MDNPANKEISGSQILQFVKMQGLENDFILFDCRNTPFALSKEQICFIANRKLGIGCDQVLVLEKSDTADCRYRIFNADGSSAGNCGNGARCVIEYLWAKLNQPQITLQIDNQILQGSKNADGSINVNMGYPDFNPQALPFVHQLNTDNRYRLDFGSNAVEFGICSVGNPHVLIQLQSESDFDDLHSLSLTARLIQNSPLFPQGVNVNFYSIKNRTTIRLHTYERGCGFTRACGTGATATACYAILQNQVNPRVSVEMPGGNLSIAWQHKQQINMTGPAAFVFSGEICI